MELEWQPASIEQWYNRAIALNRNQRESRREEERLRRRENGVQALRLNNVGSTIAANATVSSLAKKTRNLSTVGTNWACSNKRSGQNECSNGAPNQRAEFAQYNPYTIDVRYAKSRCQFFLFNFSFSFLLIYFSFLKIGLKLE